MNPEVMILHKPLVHFGTAHARRVTQLLREFVDMRGIEEPPEGRRTRRPRTCVFTSSSNEGTEVADQVLQISCGEVMAIDVEKLHRLRGLCHSLFEKLNEDEDQTVTLEEFLHAVPRAPWVMEKFGITKAQAA